MIADPIALLGVLLGIAALAFWLEGRFSWASKVGASLLIVVLGAVLSNLDLVPLTSPVYDAIMGPVTSFAIVWLLLSVNLRDVVRAGPRMLMAFGLAVVATMVGAIVATLAFGDAFPGDAWRMAGALTGTYAGGSVNFVAVGRELALSDSLFAATVAADNLVTAVWIGATLVLPLWLRRWYPRARRLTGDSDAGFAGVAFDLLSAKLRDLLVLATLAAALLVTSEWLASMTPSVPTVFWLTTMALAAGQLRPVQRLEGSFQLGLLALNLFFAIIGIGSRISEIVAVGVEVLYFAATIVLVHGLIVYSAGRILKVDVETLSVASQAAVGGPSSALALTTARGWSALALPGVLVGLLGYALGNYAGLAVAALVRAW